MNHALRSWGSLACLCLVLTTSLTSIVNAQDPSFSQFYANRIYLNPAFTGLDGGMAANAAARLQWVGIDHGFRTYAVTAETQLPMVRLGLGLNLLRNEEAIGSLTTNKIGLALSYTIPGKNNNVHFGFETQVVQKSLDWDKLIFSDELDPVYGLMYPSSAVPVLDRITFGDVSFGVVWRHISDKKVGRNGMRRIRSHLGMSFHHLPYLFSQSSEGNDSFLNLDGRVAPRTTIHGGMIIPITFLSGVGQNISLSPNFKLDMQGYKFMNFKENLTVGTVGLYGMMGSVFLGAFYQNKYWAPSAFHTDAFIMTVGGYVNPVSQRSGNAPKLMVGFSVDLNNTGVGPAAGSVYELNLRYQFSTNIRGSAKNGGSRSAKRILDCKDFF